MALVLEADRDAVAVEGPQVLAQRVVQLALPLRGEERDDLGAPGDEARRGCARRSPRCRRARRAAGSRVFQASSAAWTFWAAVSRVKGGRGGRAGVVLRGRRLGTGRTCVLRLPLSRRTIVLAVRAVVVHGPTQRPASGPWTPPRGSSTRAASRPSAWTTSGARPASPSSGSTQLFPAKDGAGGGCIWSAGTCAGAAGWLARVVEPRTTPGSAILAVFDWLEEWFGEPGFRGCAWINSYGELGATSPVVGRAGPAPQGRVPRRPRWPGARRRPRPTAWPDAVLLLAEGAMVTAGIFGTTAPAREARTAAASIIDARGDHPS